MKILDLSAGNRAMWFDKDYRDTLFIDIRPQVSPTIVADSRELPPEVGNGYSLVVFDPPHDNFGANSRMTEVYGHHTWDEIRDTVRRTAAEAHRVTQPDALMAFKWNTHTHKLGTILNLIVEYWEPLVANLTSSKRRHLTRASRNSETYWVLLRRRPERFCDPIFNVPEAAK